PGGRPGPRGGTPSGAGLGGEPPGRAPRDAAGASLDQLLVVALDLVVVALGRHGALLLHRLEQILAEPLGRAVLVGARDPDRLVADRAFLGLAGGAAGAIARLGQRVGGGAGRGAGARG